MKHVSKMDEEELIIMEYFLHNARKWFHVVGVEVDRVNMKIPFTIEKYIEYLS